MGSGRYTNRLYRIVQLLYVVIKRSTRGEKNDVERKSVSSIKFILAFLKNGCFPWPHFSKVFDHVHKFKLVSHSFEVNGAACT